MLLLEDDSAVGRLLMVHVNGKFYEWKAPKGNLQQIRGTSVSGMFPLKPTPSHEPPLPAATFVSLSGRIRMGKVTLRCAACNNEKHCFHVWRGSPMVLSPGVASRQILGFMSGFI